MLERANGVTYDLPAGGTLTVTYDRPEWVLDDNGTERRFASVPAWMRFVRETYGWPLAGTSF